MTALDASAASPPSRTFDRALGHGLVWLAVASSGFVLFEPAPADLLVVLATVAFFLGGLRLPRRMMPLLPLVLIFVSGGLLALAQAPDQGLWIGTSAYLALSSVFFAAFVAASPEPRLKLVLNAWTVAAVIAATAAVAGYFLGIAEFTRYGRASGTFQDPNVLGPFLVAPAVYALVNVVTRGPHRALLPLLMFGLFAAAVLLTFSRGAWGHLAGSAVLCLYFLLVTSRDTLERVRLFGLAIFGFAALAIGITALLSLDAVSGLFAERASLSQSYDVGHGGRFDRHVQGFALALEKPLGIGPQQFGKVFREDPHNVYLNAFMSYGWLGALGYLALTVLTLARALRFALTSSALRPYAVVLAATFVPLAAEGLIIDTNHWRHYWLLVGLVWGLDAALYARRRAAPRLALDGWRV